MITPIVLRSAAMVAALFGCALPLQAQTSAPFGSGPSQALHIRGLAATCANCHGTDGRAVQPSSMAALAGRPADELVAELTKFRDGRRPSSIMTQIVKGYSDEQIAALSAYFAAQRP